MADRSAARVFAHLLDYAESFGPLDVQDLYECMLDLDLDFAPQQLECDYILANNGLLIHECVDGDDGIHGWYENHYYGTMPDDEWIALSRRVNGVEEDGQS